MEKMKSIPFDLAMAKEIHEGKLEGEIVTRKGNPVKILGFDLNVVGGDIAFVFRQDNTSKGSIIVADNDGFVINECKTDLLDLLLRVPDDTPAFKPFNKVLVRNARTDVWRCELFSHIDQNNTHFPYVCMNAKYAFCIPYEGNEELTGTTNESKNE